jgi:acyl carrier protein
MGCNVTLVKGSVANIADVTNAVEQATDAPLKGILQMSIVLRDTLLANMTWDDWELVRAPKVQGTWNLHNATVDAGLDLDFFVCFASIAGAIGTKGQTSYAASNTFLDAFVQYRNSLGLTASAIDLAAVEDVGIIAQSKDVLSQLHSQGFWTIRQNEVIDALAVATGPASSKAARHDGAYVHANTFVLGLGTATPLSNANNRVPWRRDPRMAIYHNAQAEGSSNASSSDDFKSFLTSAKADVSILQTEDAPKLIATEIAKKLLGLLMKTDEEINISLGLADLGMDSLIAIDMRQWWKQTFGFNISVLEMLGMGTLEMLGQHAAKGLAASIKGE